MRPEDENNNESRLRHLIAARLLIIIFSVIAVSVVSAGLTALYLYYISPFKLSAWRGDVGGTACGVLLPYVEMTFLIAFSIALVWSLYLYATLRHHDYDEQSYIEKARQLPAKPLLASIRYNWKTEQPGDGQGQYPYSFHQLAHNHKQWAQLWFTITIAIFIGGLMYAVFNVATHICEIGPVAGTWFVAAKVIVPNIFVYALFFIAWNWSARHFRSHWHNFILNSYRHRALWRYEEIERKLLEIAGGVGAEDHRSVMEATVSKVRERVADTLMELHRLSGILLLFPGESSYTDAGSDEKTTEELVKLEEVIKSAAGRTVRP